MTRTNDMKTKSVIIVALLLACNASQAGDCSPASPIYEDRFFKYCDDARSAYEFAAPIQGIPTDDDAVAARAPEAERTGPSLQEVSDPALSSGEKGSF